MREELRNFAAAADEQSIETAARELAASIFEVRQKLGDTHELLNMLANQQPNVIGIVYNRFRDQVIRTIEEHDKAHVSKPGDRKDSDILSDSGIFRS